MVPRESTIDLCKMLCVCEFSASLNLTIQGLPDHILQMQKV